MKILLGFIGLLMGGAILSNAAVFAQEAPPTATIEVSPGAPTATLTLTATLTATPVPTLTLTPTASRTPVVLTLTPESTQDSLPPTDTITPITPTQTTLPPTIEATVEITVEVIPEVTAETTAEVTPEVLAPQPSATAETPEATQDPLLPKTATPPAVESTQEAELTAEVTDSPEGTEEPLTPSETPTATATLDIPLAPMTGMAFYQNHFPDQSGIQISIYTGNLVLVNQAETDATGAYSVAAPSADFFWLVIEAPLYRRFEIGVWPGETLAPVTLAGGDLNADGCVNGADIKLLSAAFNQEGDTTSDINNDGLTDAADLAILTGNYDISCGLPPATPTPTETPIITETTLPTDADLSSTPTAAPSVDTATPEPSGT